MSFSLPSNCPVCHGSVSRRGACTECPWSVCPPAGEKEVAPSLAAPSASGQRAGTRQLNGSSGDLSRSGLSTSIRARMKPTAAMAQMPTNSQRLTVMVESMPAILPRPWGGRRHRSGQSGAGFLPPLTEAQAEQLELMRERPSRHA